MRPKRRPAFSPEELVEDLHEPWDTALGAIADVAGIPRRQGCKLLTERGVFSEKAGAGEEPGHRAPWGAGKVET